MFVLREQPPRSSLNRSTCPSYPQAAGGVFQEKDNPQAAGGVFQEKDNPQAAGGVF